MEQGLVRTSLEHPQFRGGDQADGDLVTIVRPSVDADAASWCRCERRHPRPRTRGRDGPRSPGGRSAVSRPLLPPRSRAGSSRRFPDWPRTSAGPRVARASRRLRGIGFPCGHVGGSPSSSSMLVGHPVAERVLEVMGFLIGLRPPEADDLGQQPLRQGVPAEGPLGGFRPSSVRLSCRVSPSTARRPSRTEAGDHLADGGGADAEALGQSCRDDRLSLARACSGWSSGTRQRRRSAPGRRSGTCPDSRLGPDCGGR